MPSPVHKLIAEKIMEMTAAEARAEGAFLRGPAALLAESEGAGRQVDRAADEAVEIGLVS
jgi:hypothetical protein